MTRPLILGLGNSLMGDDGVGVRVAELLSTEPFVTARADVIAVGTDLLGQMDRFEDRRCVVIVDAAARDCDPGMVSVVDGVPPDSCGEYVHTFSAPQAVTLLRTVMPSLRQTSFTWVLVNVSSASVGEALSADVAAAIPKAVGLVKELLLERGPRPDGSAASIAASKF